MSKDVAKLDLNDADILREIQTIEDVFSVFEKAGIEVVDAASMLGDGFELLKDKTRLVGAELMVVKFATGLKGDHGNFSAAHVVTRAGEKFVIVDGSTGINAQLEKYAASAHAGKPIYLKSGLVKSDYDYVDEKTGEQKPATTFYLSY